MDTETTFPPWLDNDFVQRVLRDDENDGVIIVTHIEVSAAVGKGENYSSQMYRVTVNLLKDGKSEQRFLITKILPTSGFMLEFIEDCKIFEKEIKMYHEILPALYKLQQDTSPTNSPAKTMSCKCYRSSRANTIVMEDLRQSGYKMAERHNGLDLEHATLVLRAMGRLHALSVGLMEKYPTSLDAYAEFLYTDEKRDMSKQFMDTTIKNLTSCVENWEGYERFADKLKSIDWVDRITELFKNGDNLAVLNHGDCWVNNMMFKYSETGQVEDINFVDFQMSRYVSPALDIHYFMFTSPNEAVRFKHWDKLMKEYHQEFVGTLKEIGSNSEILTLEELKKEVEDKMLYGLLVACTVLPIALANVDQAPDLDKMKDMDSLADEESTLEFKKTYDGMRYRGVFEKLLIHLEKIGIL